MKFLIIFCSGIIFTINIFGVPNCLYWDPENHSRSFKINAEQEEKFSETKVCETEACKKIATVISRKMNPKMDPCENFYEFACGNFTENAFIPDDVQSELHEITLNNKKIQNEIKKIIESNKTKNVSQTLKMLRSYYDICMNEDLINQNSDDEFVKKLDEFGGWPVLSRRVWNESDFNWNKTIKNFSSAGFSLKSIPMNFIVVNNNHYLLLGINSMFSRRFNVYLVEGRKHPVVQAYFKYMVDLAVVLGANRDKAEEELSKSLNFEIELFESIKMTVKGYKSTNHSELRRPYNLNRINKLMNETSKRVLANYAYWKVVEETAEYLSDRARKAQSEFFSVFTGIRYEAPRWEFCVDQVHKNFPLATHSMYIKKNFNEKSKTYATEMFTDIKKTLREMLTGADWMENVTKEHALDKLDQMKAFVAYTDDSLDDNKLDEYYKDLELHPNSYLKTSLSCKLFLHNGWVEKKRAIFNNTWIYNGDKYATAFYSPLHNKLVLSFGILQGVSFNPEHPKYLNYATIGHVIGHEINHGFDNLGRLFDKNGKFQNWWDKKSEGVYLNKTNCIVKQYNNYSFNVKGENLTVNGEQTMGENIADIEGLKASYNAYKNWEVKNGEEPRLPGFESFTPRQMFWISRASFFGCVKTRPELLKHHLMTNEHTPYNFRAIGSISNMAEFSEDFSCSLGSNMNPVNKCSIW